jgi:hypothetical protein
MAVKRERGERISREPPFGYVFETLPTAAGDGAPLVVTRPNASEWHVIEVMRRARKNKMSYRQIAAELDALGHQPRRGSSWAHTTVRQVLKSLKNVPTPTRFADEPPAAIATAQELPRE